MNAQLQFPDKLECLFLPSRYKTVHGGRGSAKSWSIARALLLRCMKSPLRILCARELQLSIAESVHHLLQEQIDAMGLSRWFVVQNTSITCFNGGEFIFSGIAANITKIKSMEGIDICWVEEAEKVSARSWEVLIPTMRKDGSEIWVSFNPDEESDPTYTRFILDPPPDSIVVAMNWQDNPWFPESLRKEKDYLYRVDTAAAEHVWGGRCRKNGAAQIFRNKYVVAEFTPVSETEFDNWDGPYLGADWGFSQDPACIVKCWIHERRLYIEYDNGGVGVEMEDIGPLFHQVPDIDGITIRADSARPETISYVARNAGLRVISVDKWAGSIEDGIAFLRSFEQIVIHPRCTHVIEEARLYSFKVDRLTGDVLTDIVDRFNHRWDAIRYALQPLIKKNTSIYDVL